MAKQARAPKAKKVRTSITSQLREKLLVGTAPEDAARWVLEPYGSPDGDEPDALCKYVWAIVLKEARTIQRVIEQETRQIAFGSHHASRESVEQARIALPRTVYRLPGGEQVLWDDLTGDMIRAKIAWLRAQIGGIIDHINVLEAGLELLAKYQAKTLGEIPNWVTLVSERVILEPVPETPAVEAPVAEEPPAPVVVVEKVPAVRPVRKTVRAFPRAS